MRLVIKIGTSLLTDKNGQLNQAILTHLVEQIAALHKKGCQCAVVSSGAVAAGRSQLTFKHEKKNIPFRQALASAGQVVLMKKYQELFQKHGIAVAQALLTNYDFTNRENFLNAKNVFELLLKNRAIPVVNENDVTTVAELKFGDNDMLSAKTAGLISADHLIILTDVDGLFYSDPKKNPNARIINFVDKIDDPIKRFAAGASSNRSLGGMITKLEAAGYATSIGISVCIANGNHRGILQKAVENCSNNGALKIGTFFSAAADRIESQKKWLRPKIVKNAWIEIDDGAAKALAKMGKSLLPSGISAVHGDFKRGDVVAVKHAGSEIAYGQINYAASDLNKIAKHKSSEIENILGFSFEEEAVHRDRMVIL